MYLTRQTLASQLTLQSAHRPHSLMLKICLNAGTLLAHSRQVPLCTLGSACIPTPHPI